MASFLNPFAAVEITRANLPHWKQEGVTYFVTFRLVDSLPEVRLKQWLQEKAIWKAHHPEPVSDKDLAEYHERFSGMMEDWLDQGAGSCVLALSECRGIVTEALRHGDGNRYVLGEFVVAANHVHVLVTPVQSQELSAILHTWKSFTAKQIIKVDETARALAGYWEVMKERRTGGNGTVQRPVWQKESFDHIARSEASLQRFEEYIRGHREWRPAR